MRASFSFKSISKLRIWAWIDTSSAEVGSSQITKPGRKRQRPRNADALTLTSGEAVWVTPHMERIETDESDELMHHLTAGARIADAMDDKRLLNDIVNCHPWIRMIRTDPEI